MRKLILVMFAILLCGGMAIAGPGNATGPGTGDILGQGKLPSESHKIFRLVRYHPVAGTEADDATLTANSLVVWDTATADDGVTVTTSTTSFDTTVAGIIVNAALTPEAGAYANTATQDIGKRNWTWLQTYGRANGRLALGLGGTLLVKGAFAQSSSKGCIGVFSPDSSLAAAGSVATSQTKWGIAGFAMDTATGTTEGTEVAVFLRGLD